MVKLAFFATALVQAFASRSEASNLLQMTEHSKLSLAGEADRSEYLNNVKQQILTMAQTGVPDSAVTILDSIATTLSTQVLNTIMWEKGNHTAMHDQEYLRFAGATTTYTDAIAAANTYQTGTVDPDQAAHLACRGDESTAYTANEACNGEQAHAQTEYNRSEHALKGLSQDRDSLCVDADFAWRDQTVNPEADLDAMADAASSYKTGIDELVGTRRLLIAKIAQCAANATALALQKGTCDDDQDTFETVSCTHAGMVTAAVNSYTSSYNAAKSDFEALWDNWDNQSRDRLAQCQLVHNLICYVNALKDNDDATPLTAAIGACDTSYAAGSGECAEFGFTHSLTPAADAMDPTPLVCSDAGFVYIDGLWPTGTTAADCSAC